MAELSDCNGFGGYIMCEAGSTGEVEILLRLFALVWLGTGSRLVMMLSLTPRGCDEKRSPSSSSSCHLIVTSSHRHIVTRSSHSLRSCDACDASHTSLLITHSLTHSSLTHHSLITHSLTFHYGIL